MGMYQRCNEGNMSAIGLAEKSRAILYENLPLTEYEAEITEEIVNTRFVFGTLIWLDIFSSITAGTTPHLLFYHASALALTSQIKLEVIMGCKNSVMVQMGRIAALFGQKCEAIQQGPFDCSSLEQTVVDIDRDIQCGLTQGALETFNISGTASATTFNMTSDPSILITRMFLHAASIYLHLVVQGFQNLELLDTTISEVMTMLKTQTSVQILQALICPIFFIACAAKQDDEPFFRNAFSSPPLLDPSLKHRGKILPILDQIWTGRRTILGFGWEDCVELTKDILLI
jgi:C6 transcription factor Pro1